MLLKHYDKVPLGYENPICGSITLSQIVKQNTKRLGLRQHFPQNTWSKSHKI